MNFKIEPEFQDLIPPMSPEEYEMLEKSIIKDGCREPLIIWAGENILLDGHNRFKICLENKIEYKVVKKEFDGEDAAKNWMLMNQLGRRNLSPDNLTILRGQLYGLNKRKDGGHGDQKSDGKIYHPKSIAKELAEKTGVSEKTIRNDAKFSDAVDNLTRKIDPNFKKNIQAGKRENTKEEIIQAAAVIVDDNPDTFLQAKSILEDKKQGIANALGDNQHELICAAALDCVIRLNKADKGSDYEKATEKDFKLMSEALASVDEKVFALNKKIGEVYHKKFKGGIKK